MTTVMPAPAGQETDEKIWAHSGDSHLMEPADLWTSRLPKALADRAPRSERGEKYEIVYLITKFGYVYMYHLATGLPILQCRIMTRWEFRIILGNDWLTINCPNMDENNAPSRHPNL